MRDFSYRRKTAKIASCATGILAIIFFASSSSGSDSSILTPAPVLQLQKQLSPGINLGNTLEAMSGETPPARRSWETAWGNPPVNKAVFEAYKAAGFKSVRIPVSWNQYADADGNITPSWMARVKQVVDSARDSGLYVMINVHWDGGWLNHTTYAQQAANNAKLTKFWIQIATTFKDYDDHLLFAGTNEVGQDNTSGAPTPEYCAVQNGYNQTFVNTVRAIGGNNATRNLVVQAYFTSIDAAISCNAMMPVDTVKNRLAMEVHYYGPYNFALNGDSKIWQWGKNATDPNAREEWATEAVSDAEFQKVTTAFVSKGVPVFVGEYGAYLKPAYPGMKAFRKDWIQYHTKAMVTRGLIPMWWDTGELFDRTTGAQKSPETIGWIVNSAK